MRGIAWILVALMSLGLPSFAFAGGANQVHLFFDNGVNNPPEIGVTPVGTSEIQYQGSSWVGGIVEEIVDPSLSFHTTDPAIYQVQPGGVTVTFFPPVMSVIFVFTNQAGDPQGTATSFDAAGNSIESVTSLDGGGPLNIRQLATGPISSIEFSAGIIDSLNWEPVPVVQGFFVRGDTNSDHTLSLADAIDILQHLFVPGSPLDCLDSADTNDDGLLALSDAIGVLQHLFVPGATLTAPPVPPLDPLNDPWLCGVDATPDDPMPPASGDLGCATYDIGGCDN